MSAPRVIRSCVLIWLAAIGLAVLLIVIVNVVEAVLHARGWF